MANKLKNLRLTSVDLVRAGANQAADICLFKSAPEAQSNRDPPSSECQANKTEKLNNHHEGGYSTMIKIDKRKFTEEERAQYEALLAKAAVVLEADEGETDEGIPEEVEDATPAAPAKKKKTCKTKGSRNDEEPAQKSVSPEFTAALERLENLEKSIQMKEFTDIAAKYAPLGEDVDKLAKSLYDMKQSNEANYNAYVGILDKSLDLVEKSGLFSEIGKSGAVGAVSGGAVGKIEAAATEIQKSDANLSRVQAIAKAWENHPELVREYDAEYKASR